MGYRVGEKVEGVGKPWSCCLRHIMKHEQVRQGAGGYRVWTSVVITELHEDGSAFEQLDDGADLATCKPVGSTIREEGYHIEKFRRTDRLDLPDRHHTAQHVTNLGTCSPVLTIHSVLTTD
jgi:hypothetical protein